MGAHVPADHHVLERGHVGEKAMFWNVRAIPDLATSCTALGFVRLAAELEVPESGA
jgi:hypothetical protein